MKRLAAVLTCVSFIYAQTVTTQPHPIPPSSLTFFSYSPVPPPTPPIGTQFLLTFPNQATGSQLTPVNCSTYANLKYNHFVYDPSSATWSGPVTGPVYGFFTTFDATTTPTSNWSGLSTNLSMTGSLGANSSPSTQTFIQSMFFSTDNCYEFGPEVGFYRLLQNPGNATEQNTVVFYYGLNVNCYNVGALGSCRDKVSGSSLVFNVVSTPITVTGVNSHGGANFNFSAYLSTPTNFRVMITDPFTGANIVSPVNVSVNPSGFFGPTANQMFSGGLTGYMTVTQQRNSIIGGITDSMTNPLKMSVFGLASLSLLFGPPAVLGRQAAWGWCEKGGVSVYASSSSGGTPTTRQFQQSYPGCSVSVYQTGTTTRVNIFSDNAGTPLSNPFTATTSGYWRFFADNGTYDVQFTGGGITSPFTLGAITLFDFSTWAPTNFFATNEIGVYGAGSSSFTLGFKAPAITASTAWTLPPADAAGCLASNGVGILSFIGCGPGGPVTGGVQYNLNGSLAGDSNFVWDRVAQTLSITGITSTPALRINQGFIQTAGGIFSAANSWQGFNTNTDGALFRGSHIAPTVAGTTGGYINIAPLGYANQPLPLSGLSAFGNHTALLWVSATNTMAADITFGLNTNLFINASGGFAVCPNVGGNCAAGQFNSFQAPNAGMFAKSFTSINYIQSGNSSGIPALTAGDSFNAGALYWDTALGVERVFNGSAWVNIGSGGGGGCTPGGSTFDVQFNAGGGTCGGSDNFAWDNTGKFIKVTTTGGLGANPGIVVLNGYIRSDTGFLAQNNASPTTALQYNSIQSPHGGVAALSFTGTNYVQLGNSSGIPPVTTGDTFNAGAMYYDTGATALKVFNGSAWVTVATGGATSPGGSNTSVQFNSSGSFGGDSFFFYNPSTRLLTLTPSSSANAGLAVATGFVQADAGFLATVGTATLYNSIQAPGGGVAGKSFTATKYVQVGFGTSAPTATSGDTFHAGTLYYDTTNACLEVHNGSAFACVAGSGSTPGGANTNVQFNNAGAFGGSGNFTWNNSTQLLSVTAVTNTAGINITNGYLQTDKGVLVNASTQYNSVQNPSGGMLARSFTASTYIQTGNNNGTPTVSTSDTFNAGAMYWDTGAAVEKVFNGSTWLSLTTAAGLVSSLNGLTGALTIAGTGQEIIVSPSGSTITLSTPQPIGLASNVTFGSVTAGPIQSTVTGSSIGFQTTNFNFQVDGNGNVSAASQFNVTGGSGSYKMGGTVIVDSSRNGTFTGLNLSNGLSLTGGSVIFSGSGGFVMAGAGGTAFTTLVNFTGSIQGNGTATLTGSQACGGGQHVSSLTLYQGLITGVFCN